MILHTACPICHTVFKVDEQHLTSAQGMVQCGVCGMVFNAAQHIQPTDQPQTFVVSPAPVDADADVVATDTLISNLDPIKSDTIKEEELPAVHDNTSVDLLATISSLTLSSNEIVDTEFTTVTPIQFKKHISPRHKLFYTVGTLLLTSLLMFQLSIPYRFQLASSIPALAPLFNTLCDGQLCTMTPPYDVSKIELINSNFEIDPKNKKFIKVTLELQNDAKYKLQFPIFLLTLLDNEETVISVRKIYPHDYSSSDDHFFLPLDEHIIKLNLSINDAAISNYKIRLF